MFSKMRFFSKEMFKLYLNVFLFHDLYALNVIFFLQSCILYKNPFRKMNLSFYKIQEILWKNEGPKTLPG